MVLSSSLMADSNIFFSYLGLSPDLSYSIACSKSALVCLIDITYLACPSVSTWSCPPFPHLLPLQSFPHSKWQLQPPSGSGQNLGVMLDLDTLFFYISPTSKATTNPTKTSFLLSNSSTTNRFKVLSSVIRIISVGPSWPRVFCSFVLYSILNTGIGIQTSVKSCVIPPLSTVQLLPTLLKGKGKVLMKGLWGLLWSTPLPPLGLQHLLFFLYSFSFSYIGCFDILHPCQAYSHRRIFAWVASFPFSSLPLVSEAPAPDSSSALYSENSLAHWYFPWLL